jgi:RNA polymerase sigma-70 factor, ECF subfamily
MGKDVTTLASEELMLLVAIGNERAFSCLLERHKEHVFRLIYRFVGNEEEANDLAQEVFLRVWRSSKHYQPTSKFTTWLYTVAANVCKSELQSLWRRNVRLLGSLWTSPDSEAPELPEPVSPDLSPEDAVLRAEHGRMVRSAIRSLPYKQRFALVLRRYEELSYQEIATVMNCSVPAVEALLARAKAGLQKKLASSQK